MKVHLMEELGDDMPSSIHFDIGYYEKHSSKCSLVCADDLEGMYVNMKTDEVFLWCDARCSDDGSNVRKRKSGAPGTSSKLEEEDVDEHYRILTEKHGDMYTVPQRRLWARTIHCGTYDNYETPPPLPMFGPPAKRPKTDSFSNAITNAAIAITKAISPPIPVTQGFDHKQLSVGISPGKSADLRMKNLQQLRYIQTLFEDKILTENEFIEQKRNILDALRKLND